MSDDLVNQLTLNYLISKSQLLKLNKKTKENTEQQKIILIQEYSEKIKLLFNNLLDFNPPESLLYEVKYAFENFVEKAIYYLKTEHELDNSSFQQIHTDIDFEKEEREIENMNFKENYTNYYEDNEEERDIEDEEEIKEEERDDEEDQSKEVEYLESKSDFNLNLKINLNHDPIIVKSQYQKKTNSQGVDDIQKLPLEWFDKIRENYKKNQIIPVYKEKFPTEPSFTDVKKKI
jgi:hypothetical protein